MTVDNVGGPPQLLHRLHHATHKEDAALVVIGAHGLFGHPVGTTLKIVVVVDKIDLHTSRLNRSYLDDKGVIGVVDDQVHTRQPNDLVQLITTLVNRPVLRHKRTNLVPSILNTLRQMATYMGNLRFRQIRSDLLGNK